MAEPDLNPRAVPGNNQPDLAALYAEYNTLLPDQVKAELEAEIKRAQELVAALGRLPAKIENADDAGKYAQLIGFATKCVGSAETKRGVMTEGPLEAQRIIMGQVRALVFDKLGEPKTNEQGSWGDGSVKQIAQDRLTAWDRAEADRKRKILEEEARKQREAEEAARKAAAEAERIRRENEEAARKAQAEREKAMESEQDLEKAIAAQAAEEQAQKERDRQAAAAAAAAEQARLDAEKAADAAKAKASTLTHSVGMYGAKSTLREIWKARIKDFDQVDLNQARAYFSTDDIQAAFNAMAKKVKNTKAVEHVEFYDDSRSSVRS